jgi:hypothetical protein
MQSSRIVRVLTAVLLLTVAPSLKPADQDSLRYDGVYQTQTGATGQDQFLYLRFYPDAHVVAMASVWMPEKVASFISRRHSDLPQGEYRLDGSKIVFTTQAITGVVDYEGTINKDGILLHIHSRVTDFSDNHQFVFRAVEFASTPEPLTEGPPG